MLPLNESTISSLDLTVITPLTPRRGKNKDKNNNGKNISNNNNNYYCKNESRHCQRRQLHCRGCGGGGDGGLGCLNGEHLLQKEEEEPRRMESTVCAAATSPFKVDCGSSPFSQSCRLARGDSDRKPRDSKFTKKEKISDFVDFIELLSKY